MKLLLTQRPVRLFVFTCGIMLATLVAVPPVSGDDKQILDELYNEIMNAPGSGPGARDSGIAEAVAPATGQAAPPTDQGSEKLRQEIDKLTEEANVRHLDAVKFMQEGR